MRRSPRSVLRSVVHPLALGAAQALVAGTVVGLVAGAVRVHAEHYLAFGMPGSALITAVEAVDRWTALLLALAVPSVAAALASAAVLRLSPARRTALVALAPALGTALAPAALWLNRRPGFPDVLSPAGLVLNGLAVLAAAAGVALVVRTPAAERLAGVLGRAIPPAVAAAGAIALLHATDLARDATAVPHGPNILVVTIDTLRADHLGTYGYPRPTSPAVDALAAESVVFEQASAAWPKTSPSIASLMSGRWAWEHGVTRSVRLKMPRTLVTLPEILRERGYDTAGVVTNGNLGRAYRYDQGFRHYEEIWRLTGRRHKQAGEDVSAAALEWLDGKRRQRPFFLWLHYHDPHAKYLPPPPWDGMFVGDAWYRPGRPVPLSEDPLEDIGAIPPIAQIAGRQDPAYYVAQYDAEIRYMDDQLRRVLDRLRDAGLDRNTIVVFTADHGESLGEHDYWFEHGRLPYDSCLRVPLIVRLPDGSAPPRRVAEPVSLVDVMPTVLDLLDLPGPGGLPGASLAATLRGTGRPRPYVFAEAGVSFDYQRIVRQDRWKLIHAPDPTDQAVMTGRAFELYDVAADPGETLDLSEREPEVARELARVLLSWMSVQGGIAPVREQEDAPDPATEENLRSLGYIR